MSIDMGQYDAMKSQPRSKEETERIFAEYKARVDQLRVEDDLLNQDKDKKLANWFTSKVDAKEAFRCVLRGEKK